MAGTEERIFQILPQRVIDNLRHPASENALIWNLIYPLAQPQISLTRLYGLKPLWGTAMPRAVEDPLTPYFWGYDIDGNYLPQLEETLEVVDGPGPKTEIDLFLLGEHNLVVVEAKNMAHLGRCDRYTREQCPKMRTSEGMELPPCRYWDTLRYSFHTLLHLEERRHPDDQARACAGHYQLARTLLVGYYLAKAYNCTLHLWLMVPRSRWRSHQSSWMDFAERIRDDQLWRRLRVLAWEDIQRIHADDLRRDLGK